MICSPFTKYRYPNSLSEDKVSYGIVETYPIHKFVLKNIHGQDVYECDYIQDCDDKDTYYRIVWTQECLCFNLYRLNTQEEMLGYIDNHEIMETIYYSKVIGNHITKPDFESEFKEIE